MGNSHPSVTKDGTVLKLQLEKGGWLHFYIGGDQPRRMRSWVESVCRNNGWSHKTVSGGIAVRGPSSAREVTNAVDSFEPIQGDGAGDRLAPTTGRGHTTRRNFG